MSRDIDQSVEPLTHIDQLIAYFRSGEKPIDKQLGVGTEHEKFVFKRDSGEMLSYDEPGGFGELFEQLAQEHGWEASFDKGKIVALVKNGAAITLEPGGQFELSGGVKHTTFETAQEFDDHIREIKALAGDRLAFVSWGSNPFFTPEQIPWMPKSRYKIMRDYMTKRGTLGHWMMKTTCTVQGNYDYTSESDAADIIRTCLLVTPLVSAMMANSPVAASKDRDVQSFRCHIWTDTDPDRTGFPEFMYGKDWGYEAYTQYILDVPMYFIRRDNQYINMSGHSFRDFMANGYNGHHATLGDFELHLSTTFPEVRMKTYIEVRGADAGSREMMLALPALWKGIIYDPTARAEAAALMSEYTPETHRAMFLQVIEQGIHAVTPNGPIFPQIKALLDIAHRGLERIAARDGHDSEAIFLDPIRDHLGRVSSPADDLRATYHEHDGQWESIVGAYEL